MSPPLPFTKMNGAGNDFVMVDNRTRHHSLTRHQIASVCDRHRGVGADGVIFLDPPESEGDFRMRYYNADGGEAEMCGNGARCFARFAQATAGAEERVRFETQAGLIEATLTGDQVRLAMSQPHGLRRDLPLTGGDWSFSADFVNTGVPHAVIFVEHLDEFPVVEIGRAVRHHASFAPMGTNVNFVRTIAPGGLQIRTYERGVEEETLACGTGVVAAALIAALKTETNGPIAVRVAGGDDLFVGFERAGDTFSFVTLTGPADFVFKGEIVI